MASLLNVPGVSNLTSSQLRALTDAAAKIGAPADWLATVISFETGGSFDPAQPNKTGSNAFGLIQFLPSTAAALLGGSREEAARRGKAMSFSEQLEKMVVPYFAWFGKRYDSLEDLYLAVFYPKAMKKADDWIVARAGSPEYEQNKGFDKTGKGYITKLDITQTIRRHRDKADDSRVMIPGSWTALVTVAVFGVIGLYLAQPFLPKELRLPRKVLKPIDDGIEAARVKTAGLVSDVRQSVSDVRQSIG